jgi:lysophospholipase L1-like esterase
MRLFAVAIVALAAIQAQSLIVSRYHSWALEESRFPGQSIAAANRFDIHSAGTYAADSIVLVGDSLIELFPASEYLRDIRYVNRGIAGDTIGGVIRRIEPILNSGAGAVFVMVGVNDFQKGRPVPEIAADARILVDMLCRSGKPAIYFAVLPPHERAYRREIVSRNAAVTYPEVEAVEAYNGLVAEMTSGCATVQFASLDSLLDENGSISERFTIDGLHLSGNGLKVLAAEIAGLSPHLGY